MGITGQSLKREQAASTRLAARARRAFRPFFTQRIPLATGLAFALPAAEGGTAVLADKGQAAFGHRESLQNRRHRR